jgi:hypothetical protein
MMKTTPTEGAKRWEETAEPGKKDGQAVVSTFLIAG